MHFLHSSIVVATIVQAQHDAIFGSTGRTSLQIEDCDMSTMTNGIAQRIARYKRYRETLTELGRLGDQELVDLGLDRSKFRDIAYRATYGA